MPHLEVSGHDVHYVHRQPVPTRGPAAVFLHGAGGAHLQWLYQVRDLEGVATYALDMPGHGQSGGPGRDSIQAYGDWLVAFLDAAGLDSAVLIGHSMGGAIALDMALRNPARVAGLGLLATGARLRVAPAIFDALRQDPEGAVRLICEYGFGPEATPELVRLGRHQIGATPPEVLYGDWVACDTFDVMGRLGAVAAPTLVLCGTLDRMTPVKFSTFLRDQIKGAELVLVEGAGHMVTVEKPKEVALALQAFLDDRVART